MPPRMCSRPRAAKEKKLGGTAAPALTSRCAWPRKSTDSASFPPAIARAMWRCPGDSASSSGNSTAAFSAFDGHRSDACARAPPSSIRVTCQGPSQRAPPAVTTTPDWRSATSWPGQLARRELQRRAQRPALQPVLAPGQPHRVRRRHRRPARRQRQGGSMRASHQRPPPCRRRRRHSRAAWPTARGTRGRPLRSNAGFIFSARSSNARPEAGPRRRPDGAGRGRRTSDPACPAPSPGRSGLRLLVPAGAVERPAIRVAHRLVRARAQLALQLLQRLREAPALEPSGGRPARGGRRARPARWRRPRRTPRPWRRRPRRARRPAATRSPPVGSAPTPAPAATPPAGSGRGRARHLRLAHQRRRVPGSILSAVWKPASAPSTSPWFQNTSATCTIIQAAGSGSRVLAPESMAER